MSEEKTFHLGLTMAGAVSAGAYTGGVMDYLFEVLDKWEKAKKGELDGVDSNLVPKHNVIIDAIGGTSAGGMTTVMSALYAIKGEINPVTDDQADTTGGQRNNIFYDSWINLVDETHKKTLEKALTNDDLKRTRKVLSVLNSDFIDEIGEKIFQQFGSSNTNPVSNLPSYISKNLEMLISHTMLRGIPLKVSFANHASSLKNPPSHVSYEHFLFSHFTLNGGNIVQSKDIFWLNPYDENIRKHLLKATKATGAFPMGLAYREFDDESFSEDYLKTVLSRLIKGDMGETPPELLAKIDWKDDVLKKILEDYKSISVDGGAINNEPYGEVLSILARNKKVTEEIDGHHYQNYGVVMIDPFPDFPEIRGDYEHPEDILSVVSNTLGTLKDQSKIKRREMMNQFTEKSYRGVIFPVKHRPKEEGGTYKYPIASASLGAFGGFLDIKFRHHDFYLGRNNARNFLRAFLSMPYEPHQEDIYDVKGAEIVHPIHRKWTAPMVKKFLITFAKKDEHGNEVKDEQGNTIKEYFLPIIPDMNMLLDDVDSYDEAYSYAIPTSPTMSLKDLKRLRRPIRRRVSGLIKLLKKNHLNAGYDGNVFNIMWSGIKNIIGGILFGIMRPFIVRKTAKMIFETIKKDLIKRDLLGR